MKYLSYKLINLTLLFTPTMFSDAFIALFGYISCYIPTQFGKYFSTFLFIQATITLIIKLYNTLSIKHDPKQSNTLFMSIAIDFSTFSQLKLSMTFLTLIIENPNSHSELPNLKIIFPTTRKIQITTQPVLLHLSIPNVQLNLKCQNSNYFGKGNNF